MNDECRGKVFYLFYLSKRQSQVIAYFDIRYSYSARAGLNSELELNS
jgi:hypothetical protein